MISPPGDYPLWVMFAAVAITTGALGWLSHWLSVWLAFHPAKYIGVGPLGWQGIIPKNAEKIASDINKNLVQHFVNVGQIFEYLGPERTVNHITSTLRPQLDTLVDEVMLENHTVLWENLPISLKNRMYARMHRMLPRIIDDIVEDIGDQILWLVKTDHLIIQQFKTQPEKLVNLFLSCTQNSLKHVAWFCAIVGSFLSWIPLTLWLDYHLWWILPAGLGTILCFTSWLAVRWLFTPVDFQLFGLNWNNRYQRQRQLILDHFIDSLSSEVLTSENIFAEVLKGPKSKHAQVLIKKHINKIVDNGVIRSFVQLTAGLEGFVDIKQTLCEHISTALVEPLNDKRFNSERAAALRELFEKSSTHLDDDKFKSLLWPAMQAEKVPLLCLSLLGGTFAGFSLLFLFN